MKCKHCHAEIERGAQFCPNCGKQLPSGSSKALLKVLLGVLLIILLAGVGYYGAKQMVKPSVEDLNNSLSDTIGYNGAKQTTKPEYSFEDIVALMEYISRDLNDESKKTLFDKTGFELKYVCNIEYSEGPGSYVVYVGKDITVYPKEDNEVEIQAKSDHACVLFYSQNSSSSGSIRFKSKDDAEAFLQNALDYGVYTIKDESKCYFVPKVKIPEGGIKEMPFDYVMDNHRILIIREVNEQDGWFEIDVPMDY